MGELIAGETLQSEVGRTMVLLVTIGSKTCSVYNIETSGEHVYQVSDLGILAHNSCLTDAMEADGNTRPATRPAEGWLGAHIFPENGFWWPNPSKT